MKGLIGSALMVLLAWPMGSFANDPETLGTFRDWRAYTHQDTGGKICYVVSEPKDWKPKTKNGRKVNRGDIYFLVTHRPEGKVFNETNIIMGYTFKKGYEPTARIGNKTFRFYSEEDSAWAYRNGEPKLVGSMKAGSEMIVYGLSSRGTKTTDTYSLLGITAALNQIDQECKRQ